MKVGIIDAELLVKKKHRFPNLASMKISGYWKTRGHQAELLTSYEDMAAYDQVYISKVFTDTKLPEEVLGLPNVSYGGTGFYHDKAPKLLAEMEHQMPDYELYSNWLMKMKDAGAKMSGFKFYTDYSTGFLTRGCFRGCSFCVNRNSKAVMAASPLSEFLDNSRKKICLLDDNFLAYKDWEYLADELAAAEKPIQFRQGLDLRIMSKRQMEKLFCECKRDGNIIFAFDNLKDQELIKRKLDLLYETVPMKSREMKFYMLCGYDWELKWSPSFWSQDLYETFERIRILMRYGCFPYIMRHAAYEQSIYRGMYITISRWCNQPAQFSKKSLREFCQSQGEGSATYRYLSEFEKTHPEFSEYFDMRFEEERSSVWTNRK